MLPYLLKRLGGALVVLWAVITLTFFLMHAVPGGPFTAEKKLPPSVLTAVEARYKLNDPLWKQYTDYLGHVVQGDFGPSFKYPGRTVNNIIAETAPVSAVLGGISLIVSLIVGIVSGLAAASRKNSLLDYACLIFATLGVSVPGFIIAALLVEVFAFWWPVLPAALWKGPTYAVLPALALAAAPTAFIMRLTRAGVLDALEQDYIRTARAAGVGKWRILYHHALRNALLPVVSYTGPLAASLLTGSFVVETLFAIPGLGRYFVTSIYNRDYTVILGITLFYNIFVIFVNLLADLIYPLLDPRISVTKGGEKK